MLVKRLLLLPAKGDVIICILILLNVLCGNSVNSVKVPCGVGGSWTSVTSLHFTPFRLAVPFSYYSSFSLVLATKFQLISLQFPVSNAADTVSIPQGPTQKPVMNKTDPLLMTGVSRGGNARSYFTNDNNFNNRRTPVYNGNTSSNAWSSNYSKNNSIINYASVNVSTSGSSASESSRQLIVEKSTVVKLRSSSSSKLRNANATKLSKASEKSRTIGVTIKPRRRKGRTRQPRNNNQSSSTSSSSSSSLPGGRIKARRPKLLKEITLFNRQNCLAKLLCGVQVAQPPTKSSSAVNDYAYLVKAFFDRFSIRGIVTDAIDAAFEYERDALDGLLDDDAEEEDEEGDSSSERRKKKRTKTTSKTKASGSGGIGGAAAHRSRRPAFENYKPKYYDEYDKGVEDLDLEELLNDDVPEFMQPDFFRRRAGRNMTHVKPFKPPKCLEGNSTSLGKKGKTRIKRRGGPVDISRIRRKRGIMGSVKRGFMGFFNPRFDKTAYLDKRQLELETTDNKAKQFNIAEEIASRIRSPRQCRLLNWFGNDNNDQSSKDPNRMTTTITTITNTGGMIGNLDRLNGIPNLPQAAVSGNANGGTGAGSQVVTVIQQSPVGALNALTNSMPSSTSPSMLNNMGQTASNAMSQASSVASSIGSTICPFNIQELQELILKAQNAQFPHFLTTTPQSPGVVAGQAYQPVPAIQVAVPAATKMPPPSSSTVAIVMKNPPSSGNDPAAFVQLYGDFASVHTPSNSHFNRHPFGSTEMYPSPIYPASAYPTFIPPQKGSPPRAPQKTRQPVIIPTIGMAGDEDDEGEFDDGPYVYDKNDHKKQHSFKRKAKPTPKWMTTTTPSPTDDYYSYNNAIPSYSYGTQQGHGGYKVSSIQKPTTTAQSIRQSALNNHIRQYQQPPEVFDIKKKYPPGSFHKVQLNSGKKVNTKTSTPVKTPVKPKQQKKKESSASEENSDEDISGTSDSGGDDNEEDEEESEEETSSISSGSRERINLNMKQKEVSPTLPKSASVTSSNSIEASEEEEEDGSNEAEELSDGNNQNDDEEEDAESVEEDDNGGKRSYEQNDFSKDRGGPQLQSSPTVKPFNGANTITNYGSGNVPSGFLSNFMNSFGSIFKRKEKIKVQADKTAFSYPQPSPLPPRPLALAHNDEAISPGSGSEDSEELDEEEDDYEESAEESDEPILIPKVENAEFNPNSIPWPKPKQAPTLIPLDTTQLPVIIEESTSWATRYKDPDSLFTSNKDYYIQDDSGEEILIENPVESYNEAIRKNRKKNPSPTVSYNGQHGKHEIDLSKYISGLPISTNNWLNQLTETKPTPKPKKKVTKDENDEIKIPTKQTYEEDEEEESAESEEDDSSLPRIFGHPSAPQFLPSEPID